MTRLALLSCCALLIACGGGNKQNNQTALDFAGLDLAGQHIDDGGQIVDGADPLADLNGVDLPGNPTGPVFTVVAPTATSAHTSVMLDVKVTDKSTLMSSDITCTIRANNDTPLVATPITDGFEVKANIVFSSYNPALDGSVTIVLSAKDAAGNTATKDIALIVDDSGPTITMIKPGDGDFIGGPTHVTADIEDSGSGVDTKKIFATFTANATFQIQLVNTSGNTFAGDFDASQLGKSFIFPTLTIRAVDKLGNSSDISYELVADNSQPVMSLDPPEVRVWQRNTAGQEECSVAFDPVGSDAINDPFNPGTAAQLLTIRARVEDQPNSATGQTVHYVSGIDPTTVKLVAIPAPAAGATPILAVDTDGDTVCDALNPMLTPVQPGMAAQTSDEYLAIVMNPISGGQADYRPSPAAAPNSGCDVYGDSSVTMPPAPLCDAAPGDLTYALTYTVAHSPSIWTIGTVGSDGAGSVSCVGKQFDTLNLLPEGWACFAVIGSDNRGNHAISAPLRACIRRTSTTTTHPCDAQTTPPDCTGTYTQASGTTAKACSPATFAPSVEKN